MTRPTIVLGDRKPPAEALARTLRLLVPLAIVPIVAFTTFYTVPAESVGVVQRFGAFSSIEEPGPHFRMPFGIDTVSIVPIRRQLKLEFGFGSRDYSNPDQVGEDPLREKSMVTGDLNSAMVEWVVQYHVSDPRLWLFHTREPGWTLRDLCEAVMREVVGDRTVDEVITVGRQEIEAAALLRLRELASQYQLGVGIDLLQLKNVNPPEPVQASFNEVNKAQQDRENMINVANGEYNKVVPRAQGEAAQKISEAEGYKLKRVNEALGDASAFQAVLAEYVKAPEVTRTRLYLETMAEVLPAVKDTWIVDERVTQLLPVLQPAAPAAGEVRK